MKYGVSSYLWTASFGDKDLDLVAKIAAMGFQVLEIGVSERNQFDIDRLAQMAERHGVECTIGCDMTPQADLVHPDPAVRRAGLQRLQYHVDVAEQVGARMVVGPFCAASYRYWWPDDLRKRQDLQYAAQGLREASQYAGERGIRLALELLNRYETPFCNRVADGVELRKAVGNPAFGLLLDTFHLNIEEKHLSEAISTAGDGLYYVHACENDRGTPGSGHLPWDQVAGALRRLHYDGYVVLEAFVHEPVFAQAAMSWRACAPDMDALALEGLAFLRELMNQAGRTAEEALRIAASASSDRKTRMVRGGSKNESCGHARSR